MKAITIKNIDPETFRKFKVACAENSIDMRQAILKFMRNYPIFIRSKKYGTIALADKKSKQQYRLSKSQEAGSARPPRKEKNEKQ